MFSLLFFFFLVCLLFMKREDFRNMYIKEIIIDALESFKDQLFNALLLYSYQG